MAYLGTSPFTITGTTDLQIPLGVTSLQVECHGGGAGGSTGTGVPNNRAGGGGGGGAYAKRAAIRVIPNKTYTFTVGASVAAQTAGNPSTFTGEDHVECTAIGGSTTTTATGGAGGTVAASVGDDGSVFAGGNGGTATAVTNQGGGGGGEGGRSDGTGGAGQPNTGRRQRASR